MTPFAEGGEGGTELNQSYFNASLQIYTSDLSRFAFQSGVFSESTF